MSLKRVTLGCGAGIALAVLLGFGLAAWKWDDLRALYSNVDSVFDEPRWAEGMETPEQVLAYLEAHREDVALVAYSVTPEGGPDEARPVIRHQPGEPMPLASTSKVVLLGGWATQVSKGGIDPQEPIPLSDWEAWYLPGTDGGAHPTALEKLVDAGADTVPFETIVRAMIRYSDNAAADYLQRRVSHSQLNEFTGACGGALPEPPVSFLGLFLSTRNHELPDQDPRTLLRLAGLSRNEFVAETIRLSNAYRLEDWGQDERKFAREAPMVVLSYQAEAADGLAPRGRADQYAQLMASVISGACPAAEIMRGHLEWPMESEGNRRELEAFGTKGGSLPGVLTEASFLVPREGDFANEPRVVVLFMRRMPTSAWATLMQTFGQQHFINRLATDAAFVEEVRTRLSQEPEPDPEPGR